MMSALSVKQLPPPPVDRREVLRYAGHTGKTVEEVEREFDGCGYGVFKEAVGEACAAGLRPVQEEFARLSADRAFLESVMKSGADEAAYYARKTLSKVRRKLGFVNL